MDSLNYRHDPYGSAKISVLLISSIPFKKLSAMRTSQHPRLLYEKPPSSFNLRNRTQWYDGINTNFFNIVENRLKCQLVLPFTEPLALAVQNPPMPPVPAKNQLITPPDIPIDALSDQKPRPRRPTPDPKKSTASLLEKFEQALKEHYHKRKSDEVVTEINEKITTYLKEIIKHPNQSDKQGNTALVISALSSA